MIRFTAQRLAGLVMTLLVASFVVYGSIYLAPGSPDSVLFGSRQPSEATRLAVRHYLGLDQPFAARYFHWLWQVLHANLGTSLISQQPVASRIAHPLLVTGALVAYAAVLILVLGIGLGLASALRPGAVDAAITAFVSLATAVPAFVAAQLTISFFAVRLGWFPRFGLQPGFGGWVRSLTLPAVSLAIIACGLLARVARASAKQELASDRVLTAVTRGVSFPRTVRSHVLRNAAGPILSVAGLQIASLFAGAVIVEEAFGLGGLGDLLVSSVQQKDFPVVQAVALVLVIAFVGCNLAADLIVGALDPRVRKAVQP
jgi:peptide/nickel transport system permease protein